MAKNVLRRPGRIRDEKSGRFRLLVGVHFGDGPEGCPCDGCLASDGKNHAYVEGDVFDSPQDLELRLNAGPYSRKVERVSDDVPLQIHATPMDV